jgi:2-amino-4-hydroxy-6-hydroxymethyldihydropteridine diphosphokinase
VHQAYLSLGSNIQPEINLQRAIDLLSKSGNILKLSSAWESESVGSDGPNYLNACILFTTALFLVELKEKVIHPVEAKLGRQRSADKYAPRTIDIDLILFEDQSCNDKFWTLAFVVIPLAEIYPNFQNPLTQETIAETATRLRQRVWMEKRPEVFSRINQDRFKS